MGKGDKGADKDVDSAKALLSRPLLGGPKKRRKQSPPSKAKQEDDDAPASVPSARPVVGGAAWADPDDADLEVDVSRRERFKKKDNDGIIGGKEYERRLRAHFVKVHGSATWAERDRPAAADSDAETDEEEEVPTSAKMVLGKDETIGVGALRSNHLHIVRRKDVVLEPGVKQGSPETAVVKALQFHPTADLLLSAGMDKRLRFFTVDGDENPRVSRHMFRGLPILEASFTPDGNEAIVVGMSHSPGGQCWTWTSRRA